MTKLFQGLLAAGVLFGGGAFAQNAPIQTTPSCTCTCFDGRPLAVCGGGTQEGFVCTPDVCPPKPPLTPAPQQQSQQPAIPNPTDQVCKLVLGVNPANGQNEFRTVCK